jgi:hypothetical protein
MSSADKHRSVSPDASQRGINDRVTALEDAVARFAVCIGTFERARQVLVDRRRGASDTLMTMLDERLELNARTLVTLKRSLHFLELELRREHKKTDRLTGRP